VYITVVGCFLSANDYACNNAGMHVELQLSIIYNSITRSSIVLHTWVLEYSRVVQ